jgi:hypothetical protein
MKKIHLHDEKLQKIEELTKELEDSPAVRMFRQEREAERLKQRKATAESIRELQAERESLSAMREEVSALEAKVKAKDIERLNLLNEFAKKKSTYTGKSQGLESRIGRLRGELTESCDPKLLQAIEFFRTKLEFLRTPGRISSQRLEGKRNLFTEKVHGKVESNMNAVHRALRYCQEAIRSLEAEKLRPECDEGVIEALKEGIPDTSVYEVAETEHVLPGSRVPGASELLPSESQLNWEMGKIMEKAKKLLRK